VRRLYRPGVALPTLTTGAGAKKAARHVEDRAGDPAARKLHELAWAFAVLWKAPPPGAEIDMAAWLADAGIRADVEAHYRIL